MRKKHGLYDPAFEHDSCGIGLIANINNEKSHQLIIDGITVLNNLLHRGAIGGDKATGDGAGNTFSWPSHIAVDGSGNVYVSGRFSDNAFKIGCGPQPVPALSLRGSLMAPLLLLACGVAFSGKAGGVHS